MNVKSVFIILLIVCGITTSVWYIEANQTQNKTIVKEYPSKDQVKKGVWIRELISMMKEELEIDSDRFPELIKELQQTIEKENDPALVSILHSMLAEMYQSYFQQQGWVIRQRTPIEGYIPEDIREWTSNIFTQKIQAEITASLQQSEVLKDTPLPLYKEILEPKEEISELNRTLYDFLLHRAINLQPSQELYEQLLSFRRTQSNEKALIMAELDFLRFTYSFDDSVYREKLDSLRQLYKGKAIEVEIVSEQLNRIEASQYRTENRDSVLSIIYMLGNDIIRQYPSYERIGIIKNMLMRLEQPAFDVQTLNTVYLGKELDLKITYTNISEIKVSIYKSIQTPEEYYFSRYTSKKKKEFGALVHEEMVSLPLVNAYSKNTYSLQIPIKEIGLYEYVISVPGKDLEISSVFSCSSLAALSRNSIDGKKEVWVTDFYSGKPITNADVYSFNVKSDKLLLDETIQTDKNGFALLKGKDGQQAYQAVYKNDRSSLINPLYVYYGNRSSEEKIKEEVNLFTDRGIYRPGQTIFFKGVAYVADNENPHAIADKKVKVVLKDANNKDVVTKEFTTNSFGSFSGEFILPSQTLTGNYTLIAENSYYSVRVEEYKRPNFMVTILPVKEEYSFGDEVTIKGITQTFSGVNLQEGNVSYKIMRHPFWFRGFYSFPQATQVASGNTTVDKEGNFFFSFLPKKENTNTNLPQIYQYVISVTVTDSNGESQETSTILPIGERDFTLSIPSFTKREVEKENFQPKIMASTLSGAPVKVTGKYTLVRLEENKENTDFKEKEMIGKGEFIAGENLSNSIFRNLPSGPIRIELKAVDKKGREVNFQQDILLYSKKDKKPPVYSPLWVPQQREDVVLGETVQLIVGSSDKEAYILYELFQDSKNIHREYLVLNNENRTLQLPYKKEYGDGIVASFTYLREGKLYTNSIQIYRKYPDRKLTIKPETFRDKLVPGSNETWKFKISNPENYAVMTEVLASMYDASLDKIMPFMWQFNPEKSIFLYVNTFETGQSLQNTFLSLSEDISYLPIRTYEYNELDWQGITSRMVFINAYSGGMTRSAAAPMAKQTVLTEASMDSLEEGSGSITEVDTDGYVHVNMSSNPIRTNFNETAFFYPHLLTDKEGTLFVSFTIPESNTSWKFQLLAHTQDMKYNTYSDEVITQKPLMIQPNLPRSLRQGDEVSISAMIMNQSGQESNGLARIELFDPKTDAPVICLTKSQRPFKLGNGETTTVQWKFTVPTGVDLMGIRLIADADHASDGEQHVLPVLSDEILITESIPFYIKTEKEKSFHFPFTTSTDRKSVGMTLEFSSNPIWYVVQALSTVNDPAEEDIISWFTSYYSNVLSSYMVNVNPRIQNFISEWYKEDGSTEDVLSALEKNQELKNILLEETPWVLDAENETERKKRLSALLDLDLSVQKKNQALQILASRQREDGSWGWFQGFYPSRTMTLFILKGMAQLTNLNVIEYNQQEKEIQIKALNYLDKCMIQDYEALKKTKNWEKASPTSFQLEYLFVRSSFRDIPEGEAREAIRFYTTQAKTYWEDASLYGKGQTAFLLYRNGDKETADKIITWLRKTATKTEEQGMFWANNRRGNQYFISPIQTHSLLTELLSTVSPDKEEEDSLKQWLLNQKRTQQWETKPATLDAMYILLLTGNDWLSKDNKTVIQWGNSVITADGSNLGYIKERKEGSEITADLSNLTIRKEEDTPAWGAVYNQYLTPIDKVEKQKGLLDIEKRLFIEENKDNTRQLIPITQERPAKVGDKVVVRFTIRAQQEMEYVNLKDLRPACVEPTGQLSGFRYNEGLSYYYSPKDVSENFFFERMPIGTYVLEYSGYITRSGKYTTGISTLQCLYAPEFVSYTDGGKILVLE